MSRDADDPQDPATYARRALVCVLGLAPHVLTETLYALAGPGGRAWRPTEVHVLTTLAGEGKLKELVLAGDRCIWDDLCQACGYPQANGLPAGSRLPIKVHVIERDGQPLPDIDDEADSVAAADTILAVMADLCADPHAAVHASIAGGRKTMGFYLGYALSLVGRPQDRLSHVLVSPSSVENHPEFFYPPAVPRALSLRSGGQVSTSEVRVGLAMVPVVLFADGLRTKVGAGRQGYAQLVQQAQRDLVPEPVFISPAALQVRVGSIAVQLEPMAMALYLHLAQLKRDEVHLPGMKAPGMVRIHESYEKCVGLEPERLESAYARVKLPRPRVTLDLNDFKSRCSREINRVLRLGFGPVTAQRLQVWGPGDRKVRDGQYGLLKLDPGGIRIG